MILTERSVRRPVFVSMVFLAIALFGVMALRYIPVDLFPEIEPPAMSVITVYPGAPAPDVEEKITEIIEDSVGSLPNLEELRSSSKESVSIVSLRFSFGTNLDEAANDIRQNLEFAKRFLPSDAELPVLFQFDTSKMPVVVFTVTSSLATVHNDSDIVEERVMEPLQRVDGVGGVTVLNAPERQVRVEVDHARLKAQHLTLAHLAKIIEAENLSVPAGEIETGRMEFSVRLPGEIESHEELESIVLARRGDEVVRLGDVASVVEGIDEATEVAKMGTRDVIVGLVMKRAGGNTVEVAARVRERLEQIQAGLPEHLTIAIAQDTSRFILLMIDNLARTLAVAAGLVVLMVFLFLRRLRPSLIVALTMPASMIVSLVVLYLLDYTINAISLMAMALAIGMVVDNAIVVLENITRFVEGGQDGESAAIRGASEVAGAITASTLTTVSIFGPLIFVSGFVGIMFGQLAAVMIATITASLLTAMTLTPMLCGRLLTSESSAMARGRWNPFRWLFALSEGFLKAVEWLYRKTLRFALNQRAVVVLLALGVLAVSGWAITRVGIDFMPDQNAGEINITIELPVGTSVAESSRVGREVAQILEEQPETEFAFHRAGASRMSYMAALGENQGPHVANVTARLVPLEFRTRTDHEVADEIRRRLRDIPEAHNVSMRVGQDLSALLTGLSKPVAVEILGDRFEDLSAAAVVIERIVRGTEGTVDVTADTLAAKPELQVIVDRNRASRFAVPVAAAALALRQSFYGQAVSKYRAGDDDLDIFLSLAAADRATKADIEEVRVPALGGRPIRLGDFARVVEGASPVEIKRKDKQRYATVSAGVRGRALGDVARDIEDGLAAARAAGELPPAVRLEMAGDIKEQSETFADLTLVLVLGFLLVYMVMAAQFESLIDPFVIMLSVPFAVTGAFLGLLATGTSLSTPAFLGVIILIGVVVNNAIVFVDYANLLRQKGHPLREALELSGARRLRPVLMTSLTTAAGMLPMALATGEGAGVWQPMGRAALGGLLLSTFVTLLLVPVMYSLVERLRSKRRFRRDEAVPAEGPLPTTEPA